MLKAKPLVTVLLLYTIALSSVSADQEEASYILFENINVFDGVNESLV